MKVCKVAEIRRLDKRTIEEYGVPAEILMENAGQAAAAVIRKEFGIEGKRFIVLCGPGNNGGDGFVVARHLHAAGATVKVLVLADREKYHGEARKNLDILLHFPVDITDVQSVRQLINSLKSADAVIDALLGTGLDRNVEGILRKTIDLVNKSGKPVFGIDIPSGVNGNNGQVMGAAIKAKCTITFGLPKVGSLLYPGYAQGGKLYVAAISYPQAISSSPDLKIEIASLLPLSERRADANKFSYGPALVIAGAANYYWAPHASAYSFLKSGGGYVYLACPQSMAASVAKKGREVVIQPMVETASGSLSSANKGKLLELCRKMKIVVLGPGLSLDAETQSLVQQLALAIDKPLILDGDGITAVADKPDLLRKRKSPTILTPHTGELCRLTGKERAEIENNRIEILQETAAHLNAFIVLKGPHTLIGCPDGRVFINPSGTTEGKAGMATAGSGDVLNGTIAAMFCLGLNIEEAVRTGVFVHGLAGDMVAEMQGPDGMTAQDILDNLPAAVRHYRANINELAKDYYGMVHTV